MPGYNPTYNDGAHNRVKSFCKCFSQKGYEVHVVAMVHARQYFKARKAKKNLSKDVVWHFIPYYFFENSALVLYQCLLWWQTLLLRPKFVLADYCTGGVYAKLTKHLSHLIVNYRGDTIDEAKFSQGLQEDDPHLKVLKKFLKESVKNANSSICVSRNLKTNIETRTSLSLKSCFIFPCCADLSRFQNITCEHREEDVITFGYFGGLNAWQCFDEVIEATLKAKNRGLKVRLLVLTQSDWQPYKLKLQQLDGQHEIRSVSSSDIPQAIAEMDISFALRQDTPLNVVSSPTKIAESLAAGVPVVVTKSSGDYSETVRDGATGLVFDNPELTNADIDRLVSFAKGVKQNREKFFIDCRIAVNGREWERYADGFIKSIEQQCQ